MSAPEPIASPARPTGWAANSKEMIAMNRKLYAAFLPLAAVVAFALVPAAAQAAPHWYKCEHFTAATHNRKDNQCSETTTTGNFETFGHHIKSGETNFRKT
jgi:hypothetical protein